MSLENKIAFVSANRALHPTEYGVGLNQLRVIDIIGNLQRRLDRYLSLPQLVDNRLLHSCVVGPWLEWR